MHTHIEQHKKDNTKKHKLIQKKKDPDGSLKEAITYSGKFVTCIANKHASLPHSPISHCHTLDEPWSTWSHWNQTKPKKKNKKKKKKKASALKYTLKV